jgi:hypothetical protein
MCGAVRMRVPKAGRVAFAAPIVERDRQREVPEEETPKCTRLLALSVL